MSSFPVVLSFWDIMLLIVVSVEATAIAYLRNPKLKALVLTFPLPFTLATMSVGTRVGVFHITGIIIFSMVIFLVYVLSYRLKMPIVLAIILGGFGYCCASILLATILPDSQVFFWSIAGIVAVGATIALTVMPNKIEPGHRSILPVWIKFPAIATIVLVLIILKKYLQGFMTMFPMVGVIALYEARYSLWTICRQMPSYMLSLLLMVITCNVTYFSFGTVGSFIAGWSAFITTLLLLNKLQSGYFLPYRN
jgi:hypothetical protein